MKIISVNVGLPREVIWKGMTVQTGIFKDPVDGPVKIRNPESRRRPAGRSHRTRWAEKALYAYPAEHYEYWRKKLPEVPFAWGKFGENLTTEGLAEETLCIGDRLRVGSAILMVTQPRMPCYKLALRFDRDDIITRFLTSQRSGFYFSVIEEGEVHARSKVEIMSRDPHRVAVVDIVRLYLRQAHDPELLHRAMNVSALPQNWKAELAVRARRSMPDGCSYRVLTIIEAAPSTRPCRGS